MSDTALTTYIHYGTNAERLAFTPNPPSNQPLYFWYESDTGDLYVYYTSWVLINTSTGAFPITPQGRLTLTTAVPYLVSDVTAATTVYYTPAVGNQIPVYNGSSWTLTAFAEVSQATTDTTKSPAACAANKNYDLFVWNDSGTVRCTRGPAWSSDTSRGSGAGTTELTRVNGILMNNVSITNGPGASRGVYVGTIRTNGSSQVDMIFGGTGATGGESSVIGIWNMYNRVPVTILNYDNTDSWNYTTLTWRIKNNNNANKIAFVIGWQSDRISVTNVAWGSNTSVGVYQGVAIGINATNAFPIQCGTGAFRSQASGLTSQSIARYSVEGPLGYNYVAPLELSTATGTSTWYGDNGGNTQNAIFILEASF